MIYETEEALLYKAKEAEGKTFGDIDQTGRIENERAKGHLGQIIEESLFGYEINSKSEADFSNLEIELKVTPIKRIKNGSLSAKERLVLNIINYQEESLKTFESSSFWSKNKNLLIMFYEWMPELKRADYQVIKSFIHKFDEEDLEIIKQDWNYIVGEIKKGLAHELSEADTIYLGACTKGVNRDSLRSQPYSTIPAMQRAYSLKQSYMTSLVRQKITNEHLVSIASKQELRKTSLEELLHNRFSPYIGMTLEKIALKFNIEVNYKSKSFLQEFVSSMLGIKSTSLSNIEEFSKANIHFKTIRLEKNGIPKEHMSFKKINFHEWKESTWEESWPSNYFEETKFLLVVFEYKETERQNSNRQLFFKGIKLWNMPVKTIEGPLKAFWIDVQQLLNEGVTLVEKQRGTSTVVANNLPAPRSNGICHIRPKAKDGKDKVQLPDGQWITKQAFWLDREYIAKVLSDLD
ncbi:Sau3AI family type II restriction endonuclease [Paenisporosarcina sp. OV554]|uniref:Sau3AI family type II restriction endonuclease n=1 Tax=Paenisporosarcina sp. OV554 TaxID=2135694 RepID=UPI000D33F809|nr:Sau3AI family type II restriction endonuclease [Paenisporosarcina sp. OV554]PUB13380.1 DNA mismatch repair endonuclease MutH [Paenisporosarcina sp. OV554]